MEQRTHAWIGIRAVELLADEGKTNNLVKLLEPKLRASAIGSWIPDLADAKLGSSKTDNHIFKMSPYKGTQRERFTTTKDKLIKLLSGRRTAEYLKQDSCLSSNWWGQPYKAEPKPGKHLANRAMALGITIIDLLIFGDERVSDLVPGEVGFASKLDKDERTNEAQVVLFFFMLSHFIADACMPCHCDARSISAYDAGLHKELEKFWAKRIGLFFSQEKLLSLSSNKQTIDSIIEQAKSVDEKFGLEFEEEVPQMKGTDIWLEVVNICRGSFALANIIASPRDYPYDDSKTKVRFEEIFGGVEGERLLEEISQVVLYDAVINVAMVWKHIWNKFEEREH